MSGKCFIHQIPMVALTMMNTFTATELKVHYTDRYRQTALMLCCSRRYNKVVIHKMMKMYSTKELNLSQMITDRTHGMNAFMFACKYQPRDVILKMLELYTDEELNIAKPSN